MRYLTFSSSSLIWRFLRSLEAAALCLFRSALEWRNVEMWQDKKRAQHVSNFHRRTSSGPATSEKKKGMPKSRLSAVGCCHRSEGKKSCDSNNSPHCTFVVLAVVIPSLLLQTTGSGVPGTDGGTLLTAPCRLHGLLAGFVPFRGRGCSLEWSLEDATILVGLPTASMACLRALYAMRGRGWGSSASCGRGDIRWWGWWGGQVRDRGREHRRRCPGG